MGAHEGLDFWVGSPLLAVYFVSADMEILIGKQFGHLSDEAVEELVSGVFGWIHRGIENSPLAFDGVGTGRAGELGIADKPGGAVSGHIEFRDDTNATIVGIGDEVTNLILRVVKAVGAQLLELGITLTLDAETLVVGQVPVKDVQLHGGHAIEIAVEDLDRQEMAAYIEHQTTPGKARLILNGERRDGESLGGHFHELQECLETAHGTESGDGVQLGEGGS